MDTVPTSVIECALLDGAPPHLGDGGAWCDAHNKCDHCAQDVVDAMSDELRRLKAERDRALAELDKALGEREDAMLSERNAAFNAGFDEGFASADDWYAEHAEELAEHGWARLPRDADGKHIRIGDVMEWPYGNGEFVVEGIGGNTLFYIDKDSNGCEWTAACDKHHHKPVSTVEDVLDEFVKRWLSTHHDDIPALKAEFAAKLRLAGDAK